MVRKVKDSYCGSGIPRKNGGQERHIGDQNECPISQYGIIRPSPEIINNVLENNISNINNQLKKIKKRLEYFKTQSKKLQHEYNEQKDKKNNKKMEIIKKKINKIMNDNETTNTYKNNLYKYLKYYENLKKNNDILLKRNNTKKINDEKKKSKTNKNDIVKFLK